MSGAAGWLGEQGRTVRGRLALTVALGETAGILLVAQTALLVTAINDAVFHRPGPAPMPALLAAALAVICLRAAATWGSKRAGAACAAAVKRRMRAAVMERLRGAGPLALAAERAGELAHGAVDSVEALDAYYSRWLPQRSIATLLPFTILAAVFPLDWLSGLILVLTAVFLPLSMIVIGEEAHERNRRLWGTLSRMSGRFLDVLQGLTTVRLFGAAGREARAIEAASEEYRSLTLSVLRVAFLSSFMLELISAVSIAIVAVVSGLRLLSGHMSFFPAYFILLIAPEYFLTLRQLGTFYHSRMEAVSAAEQVRALLEMPLAAGAGAGAGAGAARAATVRAPAATPPTAAPVATPAPRIDLRDIAFAYGERPVLAGASLRLGPGEHLTLVGPSGSGKSTIIAMLLGFARPGAGVIEIDGRPLDSLDPEAWRRVVAWLPQRPTIFRGSLRMNVTLGREDAPADSLERALGLAHVDEFLPRLPRGLDTDLGEGGAGLSVGQAQRVALARLFLREPGLVLLDEPLAHLDAGSAAMVSAGIEALCTGRTALVVSHAVPGPGERVVALENGRLADRDGRASS
jgi:ATP-binding cassette, subfamily C, bacterial CydD